MKLKWNWGTKIVVAYAIFIVLIMAAVIKAFNTKVDLVTDDYYAQELDYQNKLDKIDNAATLSTPVQVTQQGINVVIAFPKDLKGAPKGTVLFYRASNSAYDVSLPLSTNSDYTMSLPSARLQQGHYSVLIDWADGTAKYFNKLSIYIQ
jgi:hypothetical protein